MMAKLYQSKLGNQRGPWRDDMARMRALAQLGLRQPPPQPALPKRGSAARSRSGKRPATWQKKAIETTKAKGRKVEGKNC